MRRTLGTLIGDVIVVRLMGFSTLAVRRKFRWRLQPGL
jgi:hypothetical protein